ncbi:Hsp70 family protein [Asanoa siamensis]|uniref:Hsp70 protein n=1 Tax=Asanoa siamensis TaxID=926357 RepID=A0ABQ4CX29_9ACTN|nr:hypothetical protein [Asanoa siamensis]GIF75849.1 hypothetical protein Asi02nite_53670 [Asanoa siamensis]
MTMEWLAKRYAIGLDIGDGESCLAWTDTEDHTEPVVYTRPVTQERSVLTATARARDGAWVFGEQALMVGDAVQFTVNVKRPPETDLQTPDSVLFAQLLLGEFFTRHPELRDDCHVVVGHPSGWPAGAVDIYRRALTSSTVPVSLLSESQSALVHVWERDTDGPLDNVLIVDVGSSTTDFTIIRDLEPRNIPLGADVGCREIDAELATSAMAALGGKPAFQRAMDRPDAAMLLRLACRRAKEAQFSGATFILHDRPEALDPALAPIFDLATGWLRTQDIKHLVARTGGWADRFEALLTEVRAWLTVPPALLVLTGGGSRMDVVAARCRAVFPESDLDHDPEPSFSVARGLAGAGRHQARVARFRQEMTGLPQIPEVEEAIREHTLTTFEETKQVVLARLRAAKTADWSKEVDSLPSSEADAQRTENGLDRIIRPHAEAICRRYGIDVEIGTSIKLTPGRMFTLNYVGRIAVASTSPQVLSAAASSGRPAVPINPATVQLLAKAVAGGVAAVRQHGFAAAVGRGARVGGKYALITGGVVAAGLAIAVGTDKVMDVRHRKAFLATVEAAELPNEFVADLVADLSSEISRVVNESVAPLLKLVS